MSWQATQWAMKQVPPRLVSLPARAVLGVFAEAADKNGRASYPSLSTVAWRLDCTERNVATHVKALVAAGLLIVSPDQSPADECDADRRPVVYDLPLHWVRTDKKPDSKRRGRKPRQTVNGMKDSAHIAGNGVKDSVKRGEESFRNGMKNPSKRGEENFIQTVLEPPKEPPTEPRDRYVSNASGRESLALLPTLDAVDAVCAHFRQQRAEAGFSRGHDITSTDRNAARVLLRAGFTPEVIAAMITFALGHKHWGGVVKNLAKLAGNAEDIHHEMEHARRATQPGAQIAGETKRTEAVNVWDEFANQLDAQQAAELAYRPHAIEARPADVIDITHYLTDSDAHPEVA